MKRDGSKVQKLRAIVVELHVAAKDMSEYNLIENGDLNILIRTVLAVADIVREELRKAEEEEQEDGTDRAD